VLTNYQRWTGSNCLYGISALCEICRAAAASAQPMRLLPCQAEAIGAHEAARTIDESADDLNWTASRYLNAAAFACWKVAFSSSR